MTAIIKQYDEVDDEMWRSLEALFPWLFEHVGPKIDHVSAFRGADYLGMDAMKENYHNVRGTKCDYDDNIEQLTYYWGEKWEVFIVYSFIDEKREFVVQIDDPALAIQCKLAVL